MYAYTYLFSYIYTFTYMCIHMCSYMYICFHTCIHTHFYYICTHIHICIYNIRYTCYFSLRIHLDSGRIRQLGPRHSGEYNTASVASRTTRNICSSATDWRRIQSLTIWRIWHRLRCEYSIIWHALCYHALRTNLTIWWLTISRIIMTKAINNTGNLDNTTQTLQRMRGRAMRV